MSNKQNYKERFNRAGEEAATTWLLEAEQLRRAAAVIYAELAQALSVYPKGRADYERLTFIKPYMLLSGFALENIIKGILTTREPGIIQNGELTKYKTHNLVMLIRPILPILTDDEKSLLKRLTTFTTWAGRYPIPLRYSDMAPSPVEKFGVKWQQPPNTFNTGDPALIDSLYERLGLLLTEEIKQKGGLV